MENEHIETERSGMTGSAAEETAGQAEIPAERAAQEAPQQQAQTAAPQGIGDRHGELDEFLDRYPRIDPGSIPQAVWQSFLRGERLSLAYAMHQNALLQSRLEQLQRQEDNRRRTPGALGNQGREPDELDRLWGED